MSPDPHLCAPTRSDDVLTEEEHLFETIRAFLVEHPAEPEASDRDPVGEMGVLLQEAAHARPDDMGALLSQYDHLTNLVRQIRSGRQDGEVDPDNPYFGHLRLSDARGVRDVLIGRGNRLDVEPRIVDWRTSPIALLFYRYEEGDEYEEEVEGLHLVGRILCRRSLQMAAGRLVRVETRNGAWVRVKDPHGSRWVFEPASAVVRDGRCWRVATSGGLGVQTSDGGRAPRKSKRLSDITGLLDPVQHEIITDRSARILALKGGAGSGKTSVALHRLAWLSHVDPQRFKPAKTQVIVWSKALRNYISHLLPELGVRGVPIATWPDWARDLRGRLYSRLPRGYRENSSAALVQLKLHPALLPHLAARVSSRPAAPTMMEAIDDFVTLLSGGDALVERVGQSDLAPMSDHQLRLAAREAGDQASMVRAWLEGDREVGAVLDPEDEALLLKLYQLRVGPLTGPHRHPLSLAHLLVDEVQDLAAVELDVLLGCLDKGRSATLAGDAAQQISVHSGFPGWKRLFSLLSLSDVDVRSLSVGYRSTRSITEFAWKLLGDQAASDPPPKVAKDGPPVELVRFSNHGACIAALATALRRLRAEEPDASIAVIAPSPDLAHLYHEGLTRSEIPRLRLVQDQDFTFEPGLEVVELRDVKGLEFDYVVVIEPSARHFPDTDVARRQLHVAVTRAIHQVWMTIVETPAAAIRPFLEA